MDRENLDAVESRPVDQETCAPTCQPPAGLSDLATEKTSGESLLEDVSAHPSLPLENAGIADLPKEAHPECATKITAARPRTPSRRE